jgi:methionyl-tRNA formyltransferase
VKVLLCAFHQAGCHALKALHERGHDVLVATHPCPPDVPSLAELAERLDIPATEADPRRLRGIAADFTPQVIFSVYYRHVLPEDILRLAPWGAYNFHPSLLPRHRGSFSAPWAILDGDRHTGVTCHHMTSKLDAGDIVDQIVIPVHEGETGKSLYSRLVDAAAELFARVLDRIVDGPLPGRAQRGPASFHRREVPYDGIINPEWPRNYVERFIRAFDFPPYPPAGVIVGGVRHPVVTLEQYDALMGRRVGASCTTSASEN